MKPCAAMYQKVVLGVLIASALIVSSSPAAGPDAEQILKATGVRGGLIVHVGCGDARLTAALAASERYLVHGLTVKADNVEAAREHVHSKGLYGRVSVDRWDGRHLPYADNLVNLVLVSKGADDLSKQEILRVLAPGGVAYVRAAGAEGSWRKTVKPRPDEIDEWTHFLHDASNNAVADDSRVGPPRGLRWTCGPLWCRSHEFRSSLSAMVSAGGRLFYLFDYGLTGVTPESLGERWMLVARDAFNGVLLWKRSASDWPAGSWKSRALRSVPPPVQRRLVAAGDRVFVSFGGRAPASALDAATGKRLATYDATEGAEELCCLDGILLVRRGGSALVAIDTKAGKKLWEASAAIRPLSLAAQGQRAFYQAGRNVHCLEAATGKPVWQTPAAGPASLLLVHGDHVLVAGRKVLQALSAETGKELWKVNVRIARRELFVAAKRVWHWEGHGIVGRELDTGRVAARLNTDDVFTPGHHLRCYQSKATQRFLITPNRGIEFVSLAGEKNTQHDWARGACRYGIMPCNGLLYVPPDPCFCYPGVKLTGFNALSARRADEAADAKAPPRLERGPAYDASGKRKAESGAKPALAEARRARAPNSSNPQSTIRNPQSNDWPTYRHDARRTGATDCVVGPEPDVIWQAKLRPPLTPPVVAGGRVYVAAKDECTLYALDVRKGKRLWHFAAGGRIDSPPTVDGGRVIFGCGDGWVYCLRASDGVLAWRHLAAPADRRIVSFNRLESPWRVHGSVLVQGGLVYCTAGRSTYLDGGIRVVALDAKTGRAVHRTRLDTWARTRKDAEGKPFIPGYHIEGALSDILVSENGFIYLGQYKFDRKLVEQDVPYVMPGSDEKTTAMDLSGKPFTVPDRQPKADYETHQRKWLERTQKDLLARLRKEYGGWSLGQRRMGRHVLTTSGFLDDSWFNRTYWMYSATWPGYYLAHRGAKTGHLLVVGPKRTYAVQAYPSRNLQSPLFTPASKGYLLLADANDNEPVLDSRTRGTTKGWGYTRVAPPAWYRWVPVRVRAMVLAGERLFVAGPPDVVDPDDPMAAFEGRKGAVLRAHAAADGKLLSERKLTAPPVFDGLIAAAGSLLMSTTDGKVVCLTEKK